MQTIPQGYTEVSKCKGQYVQRKAGAKKVYKVDEYRRDLRRWQLTDFDDTSRAIFVKPGTMLFTDFEF